MLVAERVNAFITSQYPEAICDACIVDGIELGRRAHASQITAALSTTSDFVRETGSCRHCGKRVMVIRKA